MKFLKEIAGRICALWALLWFVATMLIVFIPIWITGFLKEPIRTKVLYQIFRVWMGFFFFITGLRLRRKGLENFKKGETYIIVCNHNSLLDVPVSSPFISGANKTIAKIEMSRIPIFGSIYKSGSVLVDRKSNESRKESYLKMKEVLNLGIHMCIYPEGTRNKTKEPLQPFHDGAFKLAADTKHAILPAIIFNTKKRFPNNKTFFFLPGKIEMHFLPPIETGSQTSQELKEKIFRVMNDYYVQHLSN
ncbi:MAG: 1-acyl-sn-glycerol-3-phosphate acyltransferase [Bacteroidetes bacterium]|nr:1-acyl-sn-glycerol-3-phosphate acyltransferase [Bacteroidota bacterium]MBS1930339.1 1-acyl-sn-glycerol-3-phosphate acyltransferase [Bacteroidota bacterium]